MFDGIREIFPQDWIWTVAIRVTNIPFVLDFMDNLKKGASYWRNGKTTLPEHTKYNTK